MNPKTGNQTRLAKPISQSNQMMAPEATNTINASMITLAKMLDTAR
jgi:hypothetical protein